MVHEGVSLRANPAVGIAGEARRDGIWLLLWTAPEKLRNTVTTLEALAPEDAFVRRRCVAMRDLAGRIDVAFKCDAPVAVRRQLLVETEMLFRWSGGALLRSGQPGVRHEGNNLIQSSRNIDTILNNHSV